MVFSRNMTQKTNLNPIFQSWAEILIFHFVKITEDHSWSYTYSIIEDKLRIIVSSPSVGHPGMDTRDWDSSGRWHPEFSMFSKNSACGGLLGHPGTDTRDWEWIFQDTRDPENSGLHPGQGNYVSAFSRPLVLTPSTILYCPDSYQNARSKIVMN